MQSNSAAALLRTDTLVLSACAALVLVVHFLTGNGYGFHRDELQFLDDGRHLAWGFVAYPPLTAFCGRISVALFGISPASFRLPAAIINAVSLVLTGLIARELGGRRAAQIIALFAALPLALAFSSVLQYNTLDLLAWNTIVLFTACVLRTGNPRFWLGAGVGVGIGVLSKYSVAFPAISLVAAIAILPSQRHHLRSRWFWFGTLMAVLIAAPNLIWLAQHHFITLQMEQFIHARDVRLGRAAGYFLDQIRFTEFGLPLAIAGLFSLVRSPRFRLLSVFFFGPFILFALVKGRGYYLVPAYSVLYAAGAVVLEQMLARQTRFLRTSARAVVIVAFLVAASFVSWVYLPIWRVGSAGWNWQMKNNPDMSDEIGWPELVAQVAAVRDTLPARDRAQMAVLANNYGEAGALALYGPQYHLPTPISSVNSFHDRGYGPFEPETVIVVGGDLDDQNTNFESCYIAAHVQIPYGVLNGESRYHPDILVCHHLRRPWPDVWRRSQEFG